jgi:hypothetical protein
MPFDAWFLGLYCGFAFCCGTTAELSTVPRASCFDKPESDEESIGGGARRCFGGPPCGLCDHYGRLLSMMSADLGGLRLIRVVIPRG